MFKCPVTYPRLMRQDVKAGKALPFLYGGIDRPSCSNCRRQDSGKGAYCTFNTTSPLVCSPTTLNNMLDFAAALRHDASLGPLELTPCDFYQSIRGRTLWLLGDSQTQTLVQAIDCFLLELSDMNTYHLTDNATLSQQLAELPESDSTMAQCSHLPDSTRVCYMRAPLGWQLFPGGSQPYATPLLPRMREAGIMRPDDVVVVGHGLWYTSRAVLDQDLEAGMRYHNATRSSYPHLMYMEPSKTHWDSSNGDFRDPARSLTECKPIKGVVFDPATGKLSSNKAGLTRAEAGAADWAVSGGYRIQALRTTLPRHNVPLVPLYNETVPLWWAHARKPQGDCMHYCLRSAPQLWVWRLWQQMKKHVEENTSPVPEVGAHWSATVKSGPGQAAAPQAAAPLAAAPLAAAPLAAAPQAAAPPLAVAG